MADGVVDCNFPVSALLPKKETGVTTFITKYPEYDGRGTTIAIFDSGVDPGAPGLQVTSDGKPKVIERFDCSGAGDVDTSTVVELEEQGGELQGLTGRKLKVPSSWSNPSRKWHLGVKNAADLYPNKVKERINSQLKEKLWDPQHKESLASATRELQDFEAKYSKATTTTTILSPSDKLIKEDLECRVEALNAIEKKYTDFSSFYDCVLFHDGEKWKACIDTSEKGDLAAGVILSEYRVTREFATLTEVDQLSVSINVHDNGNVLEIVGLCTSHGTHVASIASAYFPDDPDRCGIAPGAQIVSLTIGDGRLGSMETGTALVRAMIKVMEMQDTHPIHVINMSYGEHAHFSNHGRIGELMNEVVNKYGVVWVASAGNHGPALCTVGTPPDISQPSLIGVAAYVSPEMMVAEYSLRQKLPGMPYTWSSRGPTIDGDIGVTVCAPGGAITSVPSFTLSQAELMNGTSMAAPHVAGAIGVLISGLLQKGLQYSPYSIKRALENSSTYIQNADKFSQGSGLLNVSAAFEHLTAYHDVQERDMRFNVSCSPTNSKGVHIRCGLQDKPKDVVITVEPHFKDHRNTEASKKINFGVKLCLTCDASWVNCGKYLNLCNSARTFPVRVDGSALTEGVHSTSIKAYDVSCIEKGPLFQVHFTLVQPTQVPVNQPKVELSWTGQVFQANTIQRHFILVPELSTWAVLRLKSPTTTSKVSHRFVIHCMQLRPLQSCKDLEFNRLTSVSSLTDTVVSFPVKPQLILEVAIAKYWANPDDITLDYSIEFRGICPDNSTFTMYGGDGLYPIQFRSLRNEEVMPAVTLKYTVQTFRPTEAKVSPLTIRDVIPPSRQIYELVLSYSFNVPKPTEVSPNMALLSDLLYESEFESQLWMLYDSNKQLISCGDAYPDKYVVKVDKGEFILKLSIRHEKRDLLEKLVDSPILISQKLPSMIALDVYTSQTQAILSGKKVTGGCLLPQGHCKPVFIAPLNNDKAIKSVTVGQYLSGVITFTKDDVAKKSNSYIFKYMLPDAPKKNGTKTEKDKGKTKWEECCESIRDIKTSWLAKLESGDDANNLYTELIGAYPEHFSIHLAMVQSLDPNEPKKMLPSLITSSQESTDETRLLAIKILEITDVVIKGIDQDKLLSYIGLKSDTRPDAAKIKVVMDRQKAWLLEALCRRGIALCRLHQVQPEGNGDQNNTRMEQITEVWGDILKYVDQFDSKVLYFSMWHAAVNKHYGRLVKLIFKAADDKPIKEFDEKLAEIYTKLEWDHAAAFIARSLPKKYPHAYCPF